MEKHILLVYENSRIINKIYEVSDRIRGQVVDQTIFEKRCIDQVGMYLIKSKERIRNGKFIEKIIFREAEAAVKRNKKELSELFSTLSTEGEDGEEQEFEPVDVLADVESEVMAKETAALLAKGDCRRETVLQSWHDGNYNDKELSRMLAHTFGGKDSSYRIFVQRFRSECREKLQAAI